MGKYNVGYHGPEHRNDNLDGIVTLTDDTIAVRHEQALKSIEEMKKEIEKKILEAVGVPKRAFETKTPSQKKC